MGRALPVIRRLNRSRCIRRGYSGPSRSLAANRPVELHKLRVIDIGAECALDSLKICLEAV